MEERSKARQAIGEARHQRVWPVSRIKPQGRMAQHTLDALRDYRHIPEVGAFLNELISKQYRIDSRLWHYFKYKYQWDDPLRSPEELDERFEAVLRDKDATVHPIGERYIIHSQLAGRWAIIDSRGFRITVYRPTEQDLENLETPLWTIATLFA